MFGRKLTQTTTSADQPQESETQKTTGGMINPSISSSFDFTSSPHSAGPQQLTSVRIKEPFGRVFVFFTTFSLLIAMAFTAYLFLSKKKIENEITTLTAKKNQLMAEYQKPQNTELVQTAQEIVNKIKDFDKILQKRIAWTKILNEFNRETLKDVIYTQVNITADGAMQLAGQTPTNESFAKLYRAWESSEIVDSITASSFTKQEAGDEGGEATSPLGLSSFVTFSLSVNLKPEIIYPTDKELATGSSADSTTSEKANQAGSSTAESVSNPNKP